ncbi:UDP-N-acetylmuramate--L-alanine ligase [Candidatus Babeliales bacterium]|nr:UDP-N-acetylmuramate--L-alanine ligase [Candidatus Babeliales bacterium]
MSGLACLLQDRGFVVQGSDICNTGKIERLKKRGIQVYIGHKKSNIDPETDLICYSSAIRPENSELVEAKNKEIKVIKRGTLLSYLCKNTKIIAVAGSHGKTTVVSLLSYLFKKVGYKPTIFIGGVPVDGSVPACWGKDFSIIETDESDGTFLDYKPYLSIITNIDKEHLNYYKDFKILKKSFLDFAANTKEKVFGCIDQNETKKIIEKVGGVSFGLSSEAYLRAKNIKFDQQFSYFDLYKNEKLLFPIKCPLLGEHNCVNTLAALSIFDYLGINLGKIKKYLINFKGTERRFQIKKQVSNVIFIDDYAHHPTEIKATLSAAKTLGMKRLFVILQPHRPSRVKSLFKEFSRCLKQADLAVVTDIYQASEQTGKSKGSLDLVKAMKDEGLDQIKYVRDDQLISTTSKMIKEGDLVICLGAGDINKKFDKIINEFKKNKSKTKH